MFSLNQKELLQDLILYELELSSASANDKDDVKKEKVISYIEELMKQYEGKISEEQVTLLLIDKIRGRRKSKKHPAYYNVCLEKRLINLWNIMGSKNEKQDLAGNTRFEYFRKLWTLKQEQVRGIGFDQDERCVFIVCLLLPKCLVCASSSENFIVFPSNSILFTHLVGVHLTLLKYCKQYKNCYYEAFVTFTIFYPTIKLLNNWHPVITVTENPRFLCRCLMTKECDFQKFFHRLTRIKEFGKISRSKILGTLQTV